MIDRVHLNMTQSWIMSDHIVVIYASRSKDLTNRVELKC
jgi:hypothetical protein